MNTHDQPETAIDLPNSETDKRSRWLFWGGILLFLIATALISLWVLSHDTVAKVNTLQDQLAAAKPWLLAWRIGLLFFWVGFYPYWVNKAADYLRFSPQQRQVALNQRWRVALLLLLMELLFAQRGPALLLHWLFPGR